VTDPASTPDLRTRIIAVLQASPLTFIQPNGQGSLDVDYAAMADLVLPEVEPDLEEGRFAIAHIEQWERVLEEHKADQAHLLDQVRQLRAERASMIRDLHAAQFDGSTALPDRPLDTVWAWLLDLVGKDRARLSVGSTPTIPDDAADQIARTLVKADGFHTGAQNQQQTAAVLDLVRGWGSAVTNPNGTPADREGALRRLVTDLQGARDVDLDGAYAAGFTDGQVQAGNDLEAALDGEPAVPAVPEPDATPDTTGEVYPANLLARPNGRFVCVCGDEVKTREHHWNGHTWACIDMASFAQPCTTEETS
jgi:hypothetical protein